MLWKLFMKKTEASGV